MNIGVRRAMAFVGAISLLAFWQPQNTVRAASPLPVSKMVFYIADGMRPDLMQKYANAGVMPSYSTVIKEGVVGDNGLTPAFPPNTGTNWTTLATGTYPGEHGSINNTFFREGEGNFNNSSSGQALADIQASAAYRRRVGARLVVRALEHAQNMIGRRSSQWD